METATQPNLITVCDKCFTVACWDGAVMCSQAQGAGTITDTPENISKMAYGLVPAPQETPAQQERHSALPWTQNGTHIMSGEILVTQISGSNRQFLLPEFENEANAALIVKCVNRDPAFQKLVKAAQFALTTPGLIKGRDELQKAVDEVLRLAREGEK